MEYCPQASITLLTQNSNLTYILISITIVCQKMSELHHTYLLALHEMDGKDPCRYCGERYLPGRGMNVHLKRNIKCKRLHAKAREAELERSLQDARNFPGWDPEMDLDDDPRFPSPPPHITQLPYHLTSEHSSHCSPPSASRITTDNENTPQPLHSRGKKSGTNAKPVDITIENFPYPVVTSLRRGESGLSRFEAAQTMADQPPWHPYESKAEWEMAKFLVESNLSHANIDRFLKLDLVRLPYNSLASETEIN